MWNRNTILLKRIFYKSSLNHIYLLKFYILHESKLFFKAFLFSVKISLDLYEWIFIFKGIQNAIYMSLCVCVYVTNKLFYDTNLLNSNPLYCVVSDLRVLNFALCLRVFRFIE